MLLKVLELSGKISRLVQLVILELFHFITKNIQSGFGGLLISKQKEHLQTLQYIYERGTDRTKVTQGLKK